MDALASFIVRNRKFVAIAFLGLVIFSCFSMNWVNVEEEIDKYLPDSATAKQGLTVMDQEFQSYASGTVFVKGINQNDAQTLAATLSGLDGVTQVDFNVNSTTYYTDQCAKYSITFNGPAENQSAIDGKDHVEQAISGYDATLISSSFSSYSEQLEDQMSVVVIIVAILVVLILLLTSTTWAEVPVFLLTFIAAAAINMGTDFLLGTISFVSNSVAIVLQLALSVDYAIIFCNRYKEEHEYEDVEDAVRIALAASIPAIAASSLTTMAGLTAMMFMQFQLGLDMGIHLIKAIVISLLTVFLLMPFLLCVFGKWMDRTEHRSFIPRVDFLGKFAYSTRFIIPPLFVVLAIFACVSFGQVKYDFDGDWTNIFTMTEQQVASKEMEATFGNDETIALMVPSGSYETEAALVSDLEKIPGVTSVTSLATIDATDGYRLGDSVNVSQFMSIADMDENSSKALFAYYAAKVGDTTNLNLSTYKAPLVELFNCAYELMQNGKVDLTDEEKANITEIHTELTQATDQLQGDNYRLIAIQNNYPLQGDSTYNFVDSILVHARTIYGTDNVYMTGDQVSAEGFYSTFADDMQTVTILSMVLVMLVLLLTFRSVAMPILLILVIEGSIWINFAIAAWTDSYVFFMTYLIVSAIQMGANIDYAIVISTRYNDMRAEDLSPRDAVIETLNLAFPTVLTSGIMMTFSGAMIALQVTDTSIAPMGQYLATGTLITLILVNFALPQILVLGDGIVQATTVYLNPTRSAKRTIRRGCAIALGAATVVALAVPIASFGAISSKTDDAIASAEEMKQLAIDLNKTAENLGLSDSVSLEYQYAESLVTDQVGSQELEEGQAEYDAGKAELDSAKAELLAGNAEYQAALAQYQEGQAQIAAAKAEYADGEAQLAQAQADYDSGAAQLAEVQPIYDLAMPYYNEYLSVKAQYDAAVASGDTETAESLASEVQEYQELFQTALGGYTLEGIIQEYEAGQAQLATGAAEIAEGQAQLDEAAAEIAEGQAELDDASVQLAAAKAQLNSGASQIASGDAELASSAQQLEEGKQTLADNKETLDASLASLNSLASENDKLKQGVAILESFPGVVELAGSRASYSEVCKAAEQYFDQQIENLKTDATNAWLIIALIVLSAIAGIVAVVLFERWSGSARWVAIACALGSFISAALWGTNSLFGIFPFIAALILAVMASLFAVSMLSTGFYSPKHTQQMMWYRSPYRGKHAVRSRAITQN